VTISAGVSLGGPLRPSVSDDRVYMQIERGGVRGPTPRAGGDRGRWVAWGLTGAHRG